MHRDEQAVSPVVGVVLLIVIVVVMSATLMFWLSSRDDQGHEQPPSIYLQGRETQDRVELIRGGVGIDWSEFYVSSDPVVPGLRVAVSADAAAGSLVGGTPSALPSADMGPGSYLEFCAAAPALNVRISIAHQVSNQIVFQGRFVEIAAC